MYSRASRMLPEFPGLPERHSLVDATGINGSGAFTTKTLTIPIIFNGFPAGRGTMRSSRHLKRALRLGMGGPTAREGGGRAQRFLRQVCPRNLLFSKPIAASILDDILATF